MGADERLRGPGTELCASAAGRSHETRWCRVAWQRQTTRRSAPVRPTEAGRRARRWWGDVAAFASRARSPLFLLSCPCRRVRPRAQAVRRCARTDAETQGFVPVFGT
ncbi:hypothetical protein GUJ93_ZPchr0044g38090 [Zizania palustris]|uniref:Uncharacterized protein n=1 Tax=Zizania palustris TaxID=103762 RepID=A0A8J5R2K5_ZIZPA|nr:hypothetical protein GUJ93_ZPchr0044g38090 [Zizania palustris]